MAELADAVDSMLASVPVIELLTATKQVHEEGRRVMREVLMQRTPEFLLPETKRKKKRSKKPNRVAVIWRQFHFLGADQTPHKVNAGCAR